MGENDDGDSVIENELAAERESEWIDDSESQICPACHGSRLNPIARHVRVQNMTIDNFTALSASAAAKKIDRLKFAGKQKTIASELIPEIVQRLRFMDNVGLGYLSLGRSARLERRRIEASIWRRNSARVHGVLYVWIGQPSGYIRAIMSVCSKLFRCAELTRDAELMKQHVLNHIIDLGARRTHGGSRCHWKAAGDQACEKFRDRSLPENTSATFKSRRSLRNAEAGSDQKRACQQSQNVSEFPIGRLSVITAFLAAESALMKSFCQRYSNN